MKKRWLKRAAIVVLGLGLCVVGVQLVLQVASGSTWVQQKIADKISAATGREVRLGQVRLGLSGVALEEFALAKAGGFEEGTMFHVHRLRLRLAPLHVLHGHLKIQAVEVDGLTLHAVRDEQGKLNLDLSGAQVSPEDEKEPLRLPFNLTVTELGARRVTIVYEDKMTKLSAGVQDAALHVRGLKLNKDFGVRFTATVVFARDGKTYVLPVGLAGNVNLADLDWARARVDISLLSLRLEQARLQAEGSVQSFENPQFHFRMSGKNISDQALAGLVPDGVVFELKQIAARARGSLILNDNLLTLEEGGLTLPGFELAASGKANLAKQTYRGDVQITADLARMPEGLPQLEPYELDGQLSARVQADEAQLAARVELADVAARVPRAGKFAAIQGALDGREQWTFQQGEGVLALSGKLNGEPFQTDLTFNQIPQEIQLVLNARADRVVLPPAPPSDAAKKTAPAKNASASGGWPLPPLTARADVQIASLDAPYLNGKNFNFQTDLSGITPKLDTAHGTFSLSVEKGQITDLYQLTNSNALMRVMFMSLNVVGKVFNSLDVLSVLGGLAGSSKSAEEEVIKMIPNENGEMVAVKVPASSRKVDGALAYDKFATDIQFEQGVATVKQGNFVSDMMSFNLSGTTDFNTEKIDLTVRAAPGRHQTDGVMPLTLKIGGTVSEPQGNMSVLGSVSAMVTQGVTNNFASRAVKKTLGGFFGLFKKKEKASSQE